MSIYVHTRPKVQKSRSCPLPAGLQLAASLSHVLGQVAEASHVGLRDVVYAEVDAVAVQLGGTG